jgi:hypothetical protein
MNKNTGDIALGIKLHLFDNVDDEILQPTEMGKISWLPERPDFWGVKAGEEVGFVVLPYPLVNDITEVIAEI